MAILLGISIFVSCSDEFLERPPADTIVDGSFFQSDEQVLAGTALLYNQVWFDYNDKASYNLGDFRGGTAFSAWNDRGNVEFNTTGQTPENGASWRAFFNVVGQSNLVIQNINTYAGPAVTESVKKHGIAEARFMRALAYRFLVMNWGEVPIIENNLTLLSDTTIRKNTVKSVWKFITKEMRAAAADLPEIPIQPGRVTKWSAEGMLARFYLNRAGVESAGGMRNETFLDSAAYFARRVATLSGKKLLGERPAERNLPGNYARLFKFPYDNNEESLFSLQWTYSGPDTWGTQNSTPAYLAYSPDIANGDGWGGDKGATLWMLELYEGLKENGFTFDERLHATFMLPGARYPEITQTIAGRTQKLLFPFTGTDANYASIKKYVTGQAVDNGGEAASQRYGHDTYMMRLAEVYLILAEAILGNDASTTDDEAKHYFNEVRTRAKLQPLDVITWEDIFKERIVEFAMEGMAWYDFVNLHYYNPQLTYQKLNKQDRGLFFIEPNQFPDPATWEFTPTSWYNPRFVNAHGGNFQIPIPTAELSQAPNLRKSAVDYGE